MTAPGLTPPTATDLGIYQVTRDYRARVNALEANAAGDLVDYFSNTAHELNGQIDALSKQIGAAQDAYKAYQDDPEHADFAEPVNVSWLYKQRSLRNLLKSVLEHVSAFADFADSRVQQAQADAIQAARTAAQGQLDKLLPPDVSRSVPTATGDVALSDRLTTGLRNTPLDVTLTQAGRLSGGPVSELFNSFGPQASADVKQAVVSGVVAGQNPKVIAKGVQDALGVSQSRALTISRTETLNTYRQASLESYRDNSDVVDSYLWLCDLSVNTCGECLALNGTVFPLDETPDSHANCFPSGTLVCGPKPVGSTARWYVGDLIEIETVGGHLLRVTPNHPILTPQGWVAAGLLHEGGDVVCCTLREGGHALPIADPQDDDVPTPIEQVAQTLRGAATVTARTMPAAPEDFHTDGKGSEVYVVRSVGVLGDHVNSALTQPYLQQRLCGRHTQLALLAGLRDTLAMLGSLFDAANGRVGSLCIAPAFVRSASGSHGAIDRRRVADLDASSDQTRTNDATVRVVGKGKRKLRFTRDVAPRNLSVRQSQQSATSGASLDAPNAPANFPRSEETALLERIAEASLFQVKPLRGDLAALTRHIRLDRVLKIHRRRFRGHVYNLQTQEQWYISNDIVSYNAGVVNSGIIVHNCRCTIAPVTGGYGNTNADGELLDDDGEVITDADGNPISENIPPIQSGEDWYNQQTPEDQTKIVGLGKQALIAAGELTLPELVGERNDPTWGRVRYEKSLKELGFTADDVIEARRQVELGKTASAHPLARDLLELGGAHFDAKALQGLRRLIDAMPTEMDALRKLLPRAGSLQQSEATLAAAVQAAQSEWDRLRYDLAAKGGPDLPAHPLYYSNSGAPGAVPTIVNRGFYEYADIHAALNRLQDAEALHDAAMTGSSVTEGYAKALQGTLADFLAAHPELANAPDVVALRQALAETSGRIRNLKAPVNAVAPVEGETPEERAQNALANAKTTVAQLKQVAKDLLAKATAQLEKRGFYVGDLETDTNGTPIFTISREDWKPFRGQNTDVASNPAFGSVRVVYTAEEVQKFADLVEAHPGKILARTKQQEKALLAERAARGNNQVAPGFAPEAFKAAHDELAGLSIPKIASHDTQPPEQRAGDLLATPKSKLADLRAIAGELGLDATGTRAKVIARIQERLHPTQGKGAATTEQQQSSTEALTQPQLEKIVQGRQTFTDPNTGRKDYFTAELDGKKYFVRPSFSGDISRAEVVTSLADRVGLGENYVTAQTVEVDGTWYEVQRYLEGRQFATVEPGDDKLRAQLVTNKYLSADERMKIELFSSLIGDNDRHANNMWLTPDGKLVQIDYDAFSSAMFPPSGDLLRFKSAESYKDDYQTYLAKNDAIKPSRAVMKWMRDTLLMSETRDAMLKAARDLNPGIYPESQAEALRAAYARIETFREYAALPGTPNLGELRKIMHGQRIMDMLKPDYAPPAPKPAAPAPAAPAPVTRAELERYTLSQLKALADTLKRSMRPNEPPNPDSWLRKQDNAEDAQVALQRAGSAPDLFDHLARESTGVLESMAHRLRLGETPRGTDRIALARRIVIALDPSAEQEIMTREVLFRQEQPMRVVRPPRVPVEPRTPATPRTAKAVPVPAADSRLRTLDDATNPIEAWNAFGQTRDSLYQVLRLEPVGTLQAMAEHPSMPSGGKLPRLVADQDVSRERLAKYISDQMAAVHGEVAPLTRAELDRYTLSQLKTLAQSVQAQAPDTTPAHWGRKAALIDYVVAAQSGEVVAASEGTVKQTPYEKWRARAEELREAIVATGKSDALDAWMRGHPAWAKAWSAEVVAREGTAATAIEITPRTTTAEERQAAIRPGRVYKNYEEFQAQAEQYWKTVVETEQSEATHAIWLRAFNSLGYMETQHPNWARRWYKEKGPEVKELVRVAALPTDTIRALATKASPDDFARQRAEATDRLTNAQNAVTRAQAQLADIRAQQDKAWDVLFAKWGDPSNPMSLGIGMDPAIKNNPAYQADRADYDNYSVAYDAAQRDLYAAQGVVANISREVTLVNAKQAADAITVNHETLAKVTTPKEAVAWLQDAIPHAEWKLGGNPSMDAVKPAIDQLAKLAEQYPEAMGALKFFGLTSDRTMSKELRDYAKGMGKGFGGGKFDIAEIPDMAGDDGAGIFFPGGQWRDIAAWKALAQEAVNDGTWQPGAVDGGSAYAITHEFGHVIEYYAEHNPDPDIRRKYNDLLRLLGQNMVYGFDSYMQTNTHEMFAESFAALYYGDPSLRKLDYVQAVKAFVDELFNQEPMP